MVSDCKAFAHKRCKIAAQKKVIYFGKFCLTSRIFLVSVLLYALVERCFVSRMRDFCIIKKNVMCHLSRVTCQLSPASVAMKVPIWFDENRRRPSGKNACNGTTSHDNDTRRTSGLID